MTAIYMFMEEGRAKEIPHSTSFHSEWQARERGIGGVAGRQSRPATPPI